MVDANLTAIAKCGRGTRNESRQLHMYIHRTGRTLPVTVTKVPTPIRVFMKGKPRVVISNFPVIFLSSWARQVFEGYGGKAFLGGNSLEEESSWRPMLQTFWERFRHLRPDLDIYQKAEHEGWDLSACLPWAHHGDEGRGKLRRPVLILGFQMLISPRGPSYTNSSGILAICWYMFSD